MLVKQFRLRKNKDFKLLSEKGKTFNSELLFLKLRQNDLKDSRFAVVVSLKVSKKATVRNKIKRRIREVIKKRMSTIKEGLDVSITAKPKIVDRDFQEIKNEVEGLFKKSKIL